MELKKKLHNLFITQKHAFMSIKMVSADQVYHDFYT